MQIRFSDLELIITAMRVIKNHIHICGRKLRVIFLGAKQHEQAVNVAVTSASIQNLVYSNSLGSLGDWVCEVVISFYSLALSGHN